MIRLPNVQRTPVYLAFGGGLDLTAQESLRKPGTVGQAMNYEPDIESGYKRVAGYERFDGHTRPSTALPTPLACTMASTPAAGTVLTVGGVTAVFIKSITGGILVANASGSFAGGAAISGTGAAGTVAADPWPSYAVTADMTAQWYVDAADYYRTLIGQVPGTGAVRGVWMYQGNIYAFRDNGSNGVMYVASGSGWSAVAMGEEVAFTNGNASLATGTLTQGGATATVARVVVETGSLASGTNTGRLIITSRAGGSFAAGAATVSGGGTLTLSGSQSAITLTQGGKYRFRNWNFYGQASTLRMYFVNGRNRAMEFDGTTLVPISTGLSLANDTPSHIETGRSYLWLAVRSSLLFSVPGTPTCFSQALGAGEAAVGDTITGLRMLPGKAVGVFTINTVQALSGSTKADFVLDTVTPKAGSVAGGIGVLTNTYAVDQRGVINIEATQNYGNFGFNESSIKIKPLITSVKDYIVETVELSSRNQLRFIASDGRSVAMCPRKLDGTPPEFMPLQYPMRPSCACAMNDITGQERFFIGAEDGYVYEMERGSTFDGQAIEAYIKLNYFNAGKPRVDKTFSLALLELTSSLYAALSYFADFSYADRNTSSSSSSVTVNATGSSWDVSSWDAMVWDSPNVASARLRIGGNGTNMSLMFYSNTKLDPGHSMQGATIFYIPRKINMG